MWLRGGGHTSVPGPGPGRKEHFGSIGDMIVHWQGMESTKDEERVEEETFGGGRRRKRMSKIIRDFCWKV